MPYSYIYYIHIYVYIVKISVLISVHKKIYNSFFFGDELAKWTKARVGEVVSTICLYHLLRTL